MFFLHRCQVKSLFIILLVIGSLEASSACIGQITKMWMWPKRLVDLLASRHAFMPSHWCSGNLMQGIPCSSIPRRNKPRRVDLYYSSWCIRAGSHFPCLLCLRLGNNRSCITEKYEIPFLSVSVGSYLIQNFLLTCIGTVESKRGNGGLTACEILLFHHEDMGIPYEIAKFGIRQGMWGCVKKIEPGLRAYQEARAAGEPASKSALMARINTRLATTLFGHWRPTATNQKLWKQKKNLREATCRGSSCSAGQSLWRAPSIKGSWRRLSSLALRGNSWGRGRHCRVAVFSGRPPPWPIWLLDSLWFTVVDWRERWFNAWLIGANAIETEESRCKAFWCVYMLPAVNEYERE